MGQVDQRLARLYGQVRPEVALPVIVTTRSPPDAAVLARAGGLGAGPTRIVSALGNAYATTASAVVAQRLATLPETIGVFYDEPISVRAAG